VTPAGRLAQRLAQLVYTE